MKLYELRQEQLLPISLRETWEFFSTPENLPLITPPDLGFRIISELPPRIHAGMLVTYTVTPFLGIPVKWVTEITHAEEPHFFVDEQRFGPYRFWHHQHHFRETAAGTEMLDLVHYGLPYGLFGRLLNPLVAGRLAEIFAYRRMALNECFAD